MRSWSKSFPTVRRTTQGLQEGDIIHAVDGAEVNENHQLAELIGSFEPGEQIELTVIRNGRSITVEVVLGTRSGGSSLEGDPLGQLMPFLQRDHAWVPVPGAVARRI